MTKLNYRELIEKLDQDIHKSNKNRHFIAISGPPASGKSTTSEKLHSDLTLKRHKPSILQMDGFHYDNNILKEKDLIQKKGAPETFDVYGLLNFIKRLQNEPEVIVPIFDRSLELSRSSAVIISKESKVIIVEGNYLLLNSKPWKDLQNFFDTTVMLDCEEKILEQRLIDRWRNLNLSKDEINKKVYKNDLPNGVNVIKNSILAQYYLID
ncbi:AAA family ATPase [Alphaproteobacteria bacterium]|nr:AAA family ATPase [Alphaproteobacteria bacterium]